MHHTKVIIITTITAITITSTVARTVAGLEAITLTTAGVCRGVTEVADTEAVLRLAGSRA